MSKIKHPKDLPVDKDTLYNRFLILIKNKEGKAVPDFEMAIILMSINIELSN